MKKFEFRKKEIEMEFPNGVIRTIEYNDGLTEEIQDMGNALKELTDAEEINQEEIIDLLLDYADDILGEGTSLEIFKGRDIDILDVMDFINFIVNTVSEAQNEIINSYKASVDANIETSKMNRVQRRAAQRAEGK